MTSSKSSGGSPLVSNHVAGLFRAISDHVEDIRLGRSSDLTEIALAGAVDAYYRAEDLGADQQRSPDLSDAHVDRVAHRLFHAGVMMIECEYNSRFVVENWRALAREAIRLGAVVEEDP